MMKIDRLLAITVLLLNRGRWSASELAERFEVSAKTIYRDMDALCRAGLPIAAHQGTSGGFEMMEQYTIDRYWLTAEEMGSLVTAVKGMSRALDDRELDMLLEKVKALLYKVEQGYGKGDAYEHGDVKNGPGSDRSRPSVVMDFQPWGQREGLKATVSLLKKAIQEKRTVSMRYIDSSGTAECRTMEPVSLILKGNVWYVQAYCLEREDARVFRVSRMQDVKLTNHHFEPRPMPLMERMDWEDAWSEVPEQEVVLWFGPKARRRAADVFPAEQMELLEDGSFRVRVIHKVDEWFYGMVLSFGDQVIIEHPEEAAQEVRRRAENLLNRYGNPDRQLSTFPL